MAQLAPKIADKTAHLAAFPRLKAFREKVGESEFEYWVEKSTDGRGKNSHLNILLAEYERLDLDPQSCTLISGIRGYDDKAKQTIVKTIDAKLILSERDPQFGGIMHGEIVFSADGKTPISATAYAIRRSSPEPSKATVYYTECLQKTTGEVQKAQAVWATRPLGMLMKCAVGAVLKLAFPAACAGIDLEPADEKPLPPKSPVRLVDTATGEVFDKTNPSLRPVVPLAALNAPPAAPLVASQSIAAGAIIPASAAATTLPAPPVALPAEPAVPESASGTGARVAGGKAFEFLARDPDRLPLVAKVYEFMSLIAREVDEAQHRMTMRIVAGVANIATVPERWVDFPVAALTAYIKSQQPPGEEEHSLVAISHNGSTNGHVATLANLVATNAISEGQLQTLVAKLTGGKSQSYSDLSPAQAEQAAAICAGWLETRTREKERVPR